LSETSEWLYKGQVCSNIDLNLNIAFVYKITNTITGRYYIGYKQTRFAKTKQVKGKKKRIYVESDWRNYWSSCQQLLDDVERLGQNIFKREILYLCPSKSVARYLEMRSQIDARVLETPDNTYNKMINARISANHVKNHLPFISQCT